MAKKLEAEKELTAKQAELQGEETTTVKPKETIESEADLVSIEEIKSKTMITPSGDFDWDADDKGFGNYSTEDRQKFEDMYAGTFNSINKGEIISGIVVSIKCFRFM